MRHPDRGKGLTQRPSGQRKRLTQRRVRQGARRKPGDQRRRRGRADDHGRQVAAYRPSQDVPTRLAAPAAVRRVDRVGSRNDLVRVHGKLPSNNASSAYAVLAAAAPEVVQHP